MNHATIHAMSPVQPARPGHYLFAHQLVRDMVLRNSERFFQAAANGRLRDQLAAVWREHNVDNLAGQLTVDVAHAGVHVRVIITLPDARWPTEAHYAAAITDGHSVRYLLAEQAAGEQAMLCEWTGAGTHHTLGRVEPGREAFETAIDQIDAG